jgi:demethoxyubiquinone hydroxylase (CLK1/Coq7/Cat5 family)
MERSNQTSYDPSIIRAQMRVEGFKFRGQGVPQERLKDIKKALHTFHTLETMAANIYKFQLTRDPSEFNLQLITAMCNEMTHIQDFQVKLCEYGWRPSKLRWAYWIVGFVIGFGSRLLGPRAVLKTAIWLEKKAVHHYGELLKGIDWDDDLRKIIEGDGADEDGHVSRWQHLLESSWK